MDANTMTRVVGNKRIPCIVIDKETGERSQRHPVDAREMVAMGRYEYALDVQPIPVPEIKVDANGAPIALVDVPLPPFVPSAELVAQVGSQPPVAPVGEVPQVGGAAEMLAPVVTGPVGGAQKKGGKKGKA